MFGPKNTIGSKILKNFEPSNDLMKPGGESHQKIDSGKFFGDQLTTGGEILDKKTTIIQLSSAFH
jgi:hypothetical protein